MSRKAKKQIENAENEIIEQNKVRKLEEFYVNGTIQDLLPKIQEKKEQLVQQMTEYAKKHEVECKWTKDGDPIDWKIEINPLIINNYFFKPITPIMSQEPIYNAETLGMVFEYYCDILAEVNDKIGSYPSSLTTFCKMAGLSFYSLRQLKNSDDYNMRVVVEKIYDQIGDENLTMSQIGATREKTTIFKMKSQNEMVEKAQPQVKVNVNADIDLNRISQRLEQYKRFATKKER